MPPPCQLTGDSQQAPKLFLYAPDTAPVRALGITPRDLGVRGTDVTMLTPLQPASQSGSLCGTRPSGKSGKQR